MNMTLKRLFDESEKNKEYPELNKISDQWKPLVKIEMVVSGDGKFELFRFLKDLQKLGQSGSSIHFQINYQEKYGKDRKDAIFSWDGDGSDKIKKLNIMDIEETK